MVLYFLFFLKKVIVFYVFITGDSINQFVLPTHKQSSSVMLIIPASLHHHHHHDHSVFVLQVRNNCVMKKYLVLIQDVCFRLGVIWTS